MSLEKWLKKVKKPEEDQYDKLVPQEKRKQKASERNQKSPKSDPSIKTNNIKPIDSQTSPNHLNPLQRKRIILKLSVNNYWV